MEINLQPTEISSLLQEIETSRRSKIGSQVMLNCVLGAASLTIETDRQLMQEVLASLLDNAISTTERGSITFGFDVNDDELYFYVKDTGSGLSREAQSMILDEYSAGADLRLIRVKKIVEAFGGEMGVESRGAGKGCTFWFAIPYTEIEDTDTESQTPDASTATSTEPEPEEDAFDPTQDLSHDVTILIAEDNESNYLLFRSILESRYNLIHAYNGQEAVDLFQRYNVDLILMDINMPLKDGYEATREIRAVSSTVPIVAVTAYAFTTDKQRIYENGFNGYVSKPISINRLERVINELLMRK